ncbi:alanine--tRNA ligase [Pectinatus cerevisiiphilus]|uniref:Alanine--tRNA ligase n=1 Tax=Pectinatus cerevisiiphilus TaxID=86956 RepID=A0A4R3K9S1_9FIRM|nr:alanine--tRNA ligase [Pectinatus cerevisiiphilus]TCS79698.1 alanyl-tRNA synthetase [Pectinatus cerevisiiphilus]
MKYMSGNELREKFLQYFAQRGHLRLPSFSLIPENDPSLLMIGAGMAPFKPFFTGKMKPPHTRITTSQRCVRTGDIENVGRTARHQTYFEMLGNFSFGDYFKKEVIPWAWEFLTKELELPADKLWVSIYPKDEEAYKIWTEKTSVNPDHIVRMEDNFWEIGTGPCGPDSEIYIDLGEERGCGKPDCAPGCDCDRYLEIWNLVFTQYDRTESGEYRPLVKKNIDTGAGLERLASVIQEKPTNFETDLLYPIIEYASRISGVEYNKDKKTDISLKVIADHARSIAVMVMDGILPSNEGRGYVLRRILRRAVRHGRMLGIEKAFLADAVDVVAEIYRGVYDGLTERKDYIKKVINIEEERFHQTLTQGMSLLDEEIQQLSAAGKTVLDGEIGFKLYDTYGFPYELTDEILHENDFSLDKDGFDKAMEAQRERARQARQENKRVDIPDLRELDVEKLSCDCAAKSAKIVCIWKNAQVTDNLQDGDEAGIILDVTPFYAEGGGQVGDCGELIGEMGKAHVSNTKKLPNGTVYHIAYVTEGILHVGDTVKINIDVEKKLASARNHTATHLLQAALKKVVGKQVNQAGSSVTPEHLRFDFSNFEPVSQKQLAEVEQIVNDEILKALPVKISHMKQEEAKKQGAMALFGEKYGDVVRVVTVPDFSMELCGGSHVDNIGQIGLFKIIAESGVAAGIRRIEALTGKVAYAYVNGQLKTLDEAAVLLKTEPASLVNKIGNVLDENKELKHQLHEIKEMRTKLDSQKLLMAVKQHGDVNVITGKATADTMEELRSIADVTCDKLEDGVVILAAITKDNKVSLVIKASKDAVKKGIHAGKIIKESAQVLGGNGGGRPNMAQAGGKFADKLPEAFDKALAVLDAQIKK